MQATDDEFMLENRKNSQQNFVYGGVAVGILTYIIENRGNLPPATGCQGWWLFGEMMDHFRDRLTVISAIKGAWTYGDNFATVNRFTAQGMQLADASAQTKAYRYASSVGYTAIEEVPSETVGVPGNYSRVTVLFKTP